MSMSDLRCLEEMEAELSQYKKMYAELAHDNYALKELIEKQLWGHWISAKRRDTW